MMKNCDENTVKFLMHFKSDNKKIIIGVGTEEVIAQVFYLLLHRYQIGFEQSIEGSNFEFDYVNGLF